MKKTKQAIRSEYERAALIQHIKRRPLPFTETLEEGVKRSSEQNRLQRLWMLEAEKQGDQTAEEYRALCKLTLGVPILRHDDEDFRAKYDETFKPLDYETKLKLMMEPFDFPVTRLMNTDQKTRYLDQVSRYLSVECGFRLTQPNQPPLELYA